MLIVSGDHMRRRLFQPTLAPTGDNRFGVWLRPSDRRSRARFLALLDKCAAEDPGYPVDFIRLRAYVDGWENIEVAKRDDDGDLVRDPDGEVVHEPAEFQRDEDGNAAEASIELIPEAIRYEILRHLNERETLTETDRKNSG